MHTVARIGLIVLSLGLLLFGCGGGDTKETQLPINSRLVLYDKGIDPGTWLMPIKSEESFFYKENNTWTWRQFQIIKQGESVLFKELTVDGSSIVMEQNVTTPTTSTYTTVYEKDGQNEIFKFKLENPQLEDDFFVISDGHKLVYAIPQPVQNEENWSLLDVEEDQEIWVLDPKVGWRYFTLVVMGNKFSIAGDKSFESKNLSDMSVEISDGSKLFVARIVSISPVKFRIDSKYELSYEGPK
jgi:hypothetical protein